MVNAGIIGLGRWGRGLVDSVQDLSETIRFTHAVVQSPDKHQEYCRSKNMLLTDSYREILGNPNIQLIVIATPHNVHVAQIIAAAQAGKHVLCEKPLALTVAEAQMAVDACSNAGVQLGVGHDKRYWPSMQALAVEVLSGNLGDLIHIEGNFSNENSRLMSTGWRQAPENVPGGSITATGIHIVDAFINLMGPMSRVQGNYVARSNTKEFCDAMSLLCEFKSGATGVISSLRPTPVFWRVHVFGTLMSIEARGPNTLVLFHSGKPVEVREFESINALRFQLELMANCIKNSLPFPMPGKQIIDTVKAFTASATAIDHGEIVNL